MKRGFPRPTIKVEKVSSWFLAPDQAEKWHGRTYPIPYSAKMDLIAELHNGRVGECITFCKCIVCGEQVEPDEDGRVWIYTKGGSLFEDSGPFHEKCVRLTKAQCPVVHHTDYQFQQRVWADVGPLIRGKHDHRL